MSIAVFYLLPDPVEGEDFMRCFHEKFEDSELLTALNRVQELRSAGRARHVVISSEMGNSVGKSGVDSVKDGKTPDGETYDWSKAHRAGADRKR